MFLGIESVVPWERFTQTVAEAEQFAQSEDFAYLGFLGDSYPQLRRYLPTLLETFDFQSYAGGARRANSSIALFGCEARTTCATKAFRGR
jgi:hypothetical protein